MSRDFQLLDWIHVELLSDEPNIEQDASTTPLLESEGPIEAVSIFAPAEGPPSTSAPREPCGTSFELYPFDGNCTFGSFTRSPTFESNFSQATINSSCISPSLLFNVGIEDPGLFLGCTENSPSPNDNYPTSEGSHSPISAYHDVDSVSNTDGPVQGRLSRHCSSGGCNELDDHPPRECRVKTKLSKPSSRSLSPQRHSEPEIDVILPWLVYEHGWQFFLEMCFPEGVRVGPQLPEKKRYRCPACGAHFTVSRDLSRHTITVHLIMAARRHIIHSGLVNNLPGNWKEYSEAVNENDEIILLHFTVLAQRREPGAFLESVEADSVAFLSKYDMRFYDSPPLEFGEFGSLRARLDEYCILWAQDSSCTMCYTWWSRHDSLLRHQKKLHDDKEDLVALSESPWSSSRYFPPKRSHRK